MAGTNSPKIPVPAVITHLMTVPAWIPSLLIKICGVLVSSKDPVNCHCVTCPLTTLQQTLQHRNMPNPPISSGSPSGAQPLFWGVTGNGNQRSWQCPWEASTRTRKSWSCHGAHLSSPWWDQPVAWCPAGWIFVLLPYVNVRSVEQNNTCTLSSSVQILICSVL